MDPSDKPEGPEQTRQPESGDKPDPVEKTIKAQRRRRRRRGESSTGLERIAEVHYCRSDYEANQYLALGPEWDLQDIIPMRVETEDGGERDEVHFIVARWETDRERARLRTRDRAYPKKGPSDD